MRLGILALFFLLVIGARAQKNYPIKTIFKGDSVVIQTIQQSEEINELLVSNNRQALYYKEKCKTYENRIDSLNKLISVKQEEISRLDYKSDSLENSSDAMLDSMWSWSLGPSLLYSQYPDDTTIYILDLTKYYLTTDDFGIFMPRMSDREYERYAAYMKSTGLSPKGFAEFRNEGDFEIINGEKIRRRKVWKYRKKSDKDKWKE